MSCDQDYNDDNVSKHAEKATIFIKSENDIIFAKTLLEDDFKSFEQKNKIKLRRSCYCKDCPDDDYFMIKNIQNSKKLASFIKKHFSKKFDTDYYRDEYNRLALYATVKLSKHMQIDRDFYK